MTSFPVASVVLLLIRSSWARHDDPIVNTPLGKIRGYKMTSRGGREFFAFSGIPYAKPPVGDLRFKPPEEVEPWDKELEANDDPPFCIQSLIVLPGKPIHGREDCLYLSVFTANISGNAPVLFHIHGGAFLMGTSKYYGPHFLMDEDLVIVNINYRVGIFGFLSFETPEMPGNQGLKDQVMALRWVQKNIASFGGDPNQVTIIGESAGGASVYNHIVSPLSKGLFHQGIAESGTSYALWALTPPGLAKSNAERLMMLLRCPTNPEDGIPCIMNKDARTIVSKIRYFSEWQVDPLLTFGPVLEAPGPDAFLIGPPSRWEHNPVPLLMGMTSGEGLVRTLMFIRKRVDFRWLSENFDKLAPISLLYFASASNPDDVTNKILQYYLPNKEITMNDWVNLTTMYTDAWFTTAVLDGANKHKGDVYFYYFDYIWEGTTFVAADPNLVFGSSHVDEMKFLWDMSIPFTTRVEGEENVKLSQNMVKIVSNFASNGTPSLDNGELEWKRWTPEENYFVHINHQGFHLKKGLAEERYKFWKGLSYNDNFEKEVAQKELPIPLIN